MTKPITCFILLLLYFQITSFCQSADPDCDLLIKNVSIADVIERKIEPHRNIIITKGKIVAIEDTSFHCTAKRIIDGTTLLAVPGFINTHTHLWQHISKSTFPKEKLQEWIKIYTPIHYLTETDLRKVVLAASCEAVLSGITTVSDYASLSFNDYSLETNIKAIKEAGLDGIIMWHNPSIFIPDSIKSVEIEKLQSKYSDRFSLWMGQGPLSFHSLPQVYSGIVLGKKMNMHFSEHTMENVQEQRDLFTKITAYIQKYISRLSEPDKVFFEQLLKLAKPAENDQFEVWKRMTGEILAADELGKKLSPEEFEILRSIKADRIISPLLILDYFKVLDHFLSIHSVWTQQEDIEIMKKNNTSVSHNPESNMYLSSGIAPINKYLTSNVLISLGTDGAASNDGINFFSAMREMWNLYKIGLMNTEISKSMNEWIVLQAATINGAKALLLDESTGSITIGKDADINLISMEELGMSPIRIDKIITLLIYSANTKNIKYVISNGEVLVANSVLQKFNEKQLSNDLTAIANETISKIAAGKQWIDSYILSDSLAPYWYKYRSIRKADSLDVSITNNTSKDRIVYIITSGTTFGGGNPYLVNDEVGKRFPEDPIANSFKEAFRLRKGKKLLIKKSRGQFEYFLSTDRKNKTKIGSAGQILFYVDFNH